MSVSASESSASSFSTGGGSSIASDNTDARALNAQLNSGDGESGDDLDSNNKSIQEGVFATLFTLTKNRTIDTSLRLAILRVVIEFLQLFRVIFNSSFAWKIQTDLWIFKGIEWLLFRLLVGKLGYEKYASVFYVIVALVLGSIAATVWVAVVFKGEEPANVWLKRLIALLQVWALVIYSYFWPAVLDFFAFMFNCTWDTFASGEVQHVFFTEQSCLAMPHLAHMLFAGAMILIFGICTLLMSVGNCDTNPMTRSLLASSDAVSSFKILALKIILVVVSAMLDRFATVQAAVILVSIWGVLYYHLDGMPYYSRLVNMAWTGLWTGLLLVGCLLVTLTFTAADHAADSDYASHLTWLVLYAIFPAVAGGAFLMWLRMRWAARLSAVMHAAFAQRKAEALAASESSDDRARVAGGASVVSLMGDLRGVYRFRDVRQVSILCRDMRVWDEDGEPDADAAEFGEFVIKCAMSRLSGSPSLLVMYTNFLIEVRKDGQAARTQLQLAQKASPSLLDSFNIFVAQELAKKLKRDGDGLDLLSYVEFQRNYRACVRAHRMALMSQRHFWNSLLRDKVAFKDMQRSLDLMELTEARATAVYRRVLERYPNNVRVLKVFGRFLEFVRNDPWTAAKYYDEALKQGTGESLLSLTAGQAGADGVAAAGSIDEKVDGLVIINAQGVIMMVNAAAVALFGYDKGELEGKNVSVLMPQPFSSAHNGFLQRYVTTGEAHIIGQLRSMVALHKSRSMFPISLCVTRLSGVGADSLFMGVVRPAAGSGGGSSGSGRSEVCFYTTGSGLILCADAAAGDAFGLSPGELVGQSFANLCTDVEAVGRFIASAAASSKHGEQAPMLHAKLLHAFLPPVDVELRMAFGGAVEAGSDYRSIVVSARLLGESAAVMVLDHKARLVYATAKLAGLLGQSVGALTKLDLSALLPQPYCQMHGAWFKDPPGRPPPTSCRAGGVVHLLAANGTKVPVTLKMAQRDDAATGHTTHVVTVTKASESARLDQQRLLLSINHRGRVLEVNSGAPKALFGFAPSELVGLPLASLVDVFGLWRRQFGTDDSLLALLAGQALADSTSSGAGGKDGGAGVGASWRVGVHQPVKDEAAITEHAAQLAAGAGGRGSGGGGAAAAADASASLLATLQQRNRLRPACMSVALLSQDDEAALSSDATADTMPVMQVSLFRGDGLTTVVELDKHLAIARGDDALGLLFGLSPKALLKRSLPKLLGLPGSSSFEDLLGSKAGAAAKKGAMKGGGGGPGGSASRMGQLKRLTVAHLGDGKPLTLSMQAMSYELGGKTRFLVRLQLLDSASAAMPQLLAMREGNVLHLRAEPSHVAASHAAGNHSGGGSESGGEDSSPPRPGTTRLPAARTGPRNRTSDWVREASRLPDAEGEEEEEEAAAAVGAAARTPRHHAQLHASYEDRQALAAAEAEGAGAVYVAATRQGVQRGPPGGTPYQSLQSASKPQRGSPGKAAQWGVPHGKAGDGSDSEFAVGPGAVPGGAGGRTGLGAGRASEGGESASVGGSSVGDGASEAAGSVSSAVSGHDEDLCVDSRRAKRLKKLSRMVQSSLAQAATNRWRVHTLFLLAIVCAMHVACFVVLINQVDSRYANASGVAQMARSLDKFQATTLRINFLQKCYLPEFLDQWACNAENMANYRDKLLSNIKLSKDLHQARRGCVAPGCVALPPTRLLLSLVPARPPARPPRQHLYLGAEGLQPFTDERLLNYWTYNPMPEGKFFDNLLDSATSTLREHVTDWNNSRSLWDLGNVMVSAAQDVHYVVTDPATDPSVLSSLNESESWQYVYLNGPESIFKGYAWSLDTFVDYTWQDLTALSVVLIVLLVIEAVLVQLSCMAYEFYLLQSCNVSHMRLFSVFLALPSATVRLMAARQMAIDDDSREELDDDEMELAEGAAAAAAGTGGGGAPGEGGEGGEGGDKPDKKKSVRLAADLADEESGDEEGDSPRKGGRFPKEGRGSGKATRAGRGGRSAGGDDKAGGKASKPEAGGLARVRKALMRRLFGWMDPKFKRNGKKLLPSSEVVWRFMVPLLLWVAAVVVIFGVSYDKLQGLQGPLASLDLSAHVLYRMSRCRLFSNMLAFSDTTAANARYRAQLRTEIALLDEEFDTLMYGGPMRLQANVTFQAVAPPAAFSDAAIAHLFYRTTDCLRADKSACFPPGHALHDVTHAGVAVLLQRYIDEMQTFVNLPDHLAFSNHSTYDFAQKAAANDLYEGLNTAGDLFVSYTISRFESVKQLHIVLLVISLACMVLFVALLYRPYIRRLHRDSKAVVGVLSQLPAEVDVEGQVKSIVLGFVKPTNTGAAPLPVSGVPANAAPGAALGMGLGAMVPAGYPMGPGMQMQMDAAQAAGWFGRRAPAGAQAGAGAGGWGYEQMAWVGEAAAQ